MRLLPTRPRERILSRQWKSGVLNLRQAGGESCAAGLAQGVGLFVGRAMKAGSRGLGGRRYQITAALLTYAAVAVAFVPVAWHEMGTKENAHSAAVQQAQAEHSYPGDTDASSQPPAKHAMGFGRSLIAIATLLGLGLVSPFLMFTGSVPNAVFNLVIIFIVVQMAWKHMASPRAQVEGPFRAPHEPTPTAG